MEAFMIRTGFYDKCEEEREGERREQRQTDHLSSFHRSIRLTFHPSLSLSLSHRVTALEAERLEETREDRARFLADLRAEVETQARAKGVEVRLPPPGAGGERG